MKHTKGEWRVDHADFPEHIVVGYMPNQDAIALVDTDNPDFEANANLISAAPIGYELAEFISNLSATWIEDGTLEIGEGDYMHIKELALNFLTKTKGK